VTNRLSFPRRVLNELAAFPVVVAGIYVAGRLLFGGDQWLRVALIVAAIWMVLMIILPGAHEEPDPPTRVLQLAVSLTTWCIIGFIGRWRGTGLDWLLWWFVAIAMATVQLLKASRWKEPRDS